jgi:hypothetical protein
MQKLTTPQVNWLIQHQPNIAHWIDGIFYDKIVKEDLMADVYLEELDYADLPLEFHELAKQTSIEPQQPRNHWYLLLGIICVLLAITSPYWKDIAGDWFAYITLTAIAGWAVVRYYENEN